MGDKKEINIEIHNEIYIDNELEKEDKKDNLDWTKDKNSSSGLY